MLWHAEDLRECLARVVAAVGAFFLEHWLQHLRLLEEQLPPPVTQPAAVPERFESLINLQLDMAVCNQLRLRVELGNQRGGQQEAQRTTFGHRGDN